MAKPLCFSLYFLLSILFGAYVPFLPSHKALAESNSWITPDSKLLHKNHDNLPPEALPKYSNKDCIPDTRFITISRSLSRPESATHVCAVVTAFGMQSATSNLIRLADSNLAGPVKSANGATLKMIAIPGSRHIMYFSGGIYGSYIYLVRDFENSIQFKHLPDGTFYYQLKPGVTGTPITDTTGARIEFTDQRFSHNGKWMVGDVPFRGMTRINIESGEVLTFSGGYNYAIGLRPKFVMSITASGRYILAGEPTYGISKIYDLEDCRPPSQSLSRYDCKARDMLPYFLERIEGFRYIYHARFITDRSIRFHAQYERAGEKYFAEYSLADEDEEMSRLDYIALGDSFASGEGAYNYMHGTDTADPFNKCHLSYYSYPYLLSARTEINTAQSIACSGAKLKDIYYSGGAAAYSQNFRQSRGKETTDYDSEIYERFLPGYRPQSSFIESYIPRIVTVSISGNDFGFGRILMACLMPGTCFDSPEERINLAHTIDQKYDEIVATYQFLKDISAPKTKIYILGYPSLTYPTGSCALNVQLDNKELLFANELVSHINQVIRRAATKTALQFVDLEDAFHGHRLCETDSKKVAVNGLTAGDDKTFSIPLDPVGYKMDFYLAGRESYHPNRFGHKLFAEAILSKTDGLPLFSSGADSNENQPASPITKGISHQDLTRITPRKIIYKDELAKDIVIKGSDLALNSSGLKPDQKVELFSGKNFLGNMFSSPEGKLTGSINLPPNMVTGLHLIRLQANSRTGEKVEHQKLSYIAQSAEDIDGDGISNKDEECLLVSPAAVDTDHDGIDDACDPLIGNGISADSPKTPLPIQEDITLETDHSSGSLNALTYLTPNDAPRLAAPSINSSRSYQYPATIAHLGVIKRRAALNSTSPHTAAVIPASIPRNNSSRKAMLMLFLFSLLAAIVISVFSKWRRKAQRFTIGVY